MAESKWGEIKPETLKVAEWLDNNGFKIVVHDGYFINAFDDNGIKQTCYPTTRTILLHANNDKNDHRQVSLKDKKLSDYVYYLKHPEETQKLIERKYNNGNQKI